MKGCTVAEQPSILISEEDYNRLSALLRSADADRLQLLEGELDRATVVPKHDIPNDVVVMNALVQFRDEATSERTTVRLVYPEEATAEKGLVSILAPVGMALLGLRVGQSIEWPVPGGRVRRLVVESVSDTSP